MSKDPRTQRHKLLSPSPWLLLFKAVIAIGQVAVFLKSLLHD
jgi:hypothetical protein